MLRFLMLVISVLSGAAYWVWASQPLWVSSAYLSASYIGYSDPDQTVVALVQEESGAYFEWRELLTGKVVKRVQVEMKQKATSIFAHTNTYLGRSKHDVVLLSLFESRGEWNTLPFDLQTGKQLATSDEILVMMSDAVSRGHQCVLTRPSYIYLIDGNKPGFRQYEISGIKSVRIMPDGKQFVCSQPGALLMIDWETGEVIAKSALPQSTCKSIHFAKTGEIIVTYYDTQQTHVLQRWTWNGKAFLACSEPVAIPKPSIQVHGNVLIPIQEHWNGQFLVSSYATITWPSPFRQLIVWLSQSGFNVINYFTPKTIIFGALFDKHGRVVEKTERAVDYQEHNIKQYAVRTQRLNAARSICLHNTNPVWPNVIAIAMMVYILGYVYRYRKVRVT